MTKYLLVTKQQALNAEAPGDSTRPAHLRFQQSAEFSMAILMASAYEQIVCYGSGACLAYLQQQLTPPDEPPEGGSKRKGQMVNRLKADFFGGARSPPPASKRRAVV